ncbi:MAG: GerMN domain-containing protein, partial [Firmicutes bacterium]|nr:GerMN domain-containing protein [Bacillota bacterium]
EEGICYVDLSSEFISKQAGSHNTDEMTIYSIVDSLTELENVKKVQFLIEGEKVNDLNGRVDLSKPFERDEIKIIKSGDEENNK